MKLTRRRALALTAGGIGLAALGGGGYTAYLYSSAKVDTIGEIDFTNALHIPPVQDEQIDNVGNRVFDLQMKPGSRRFKDGDDTATWGFNGDFLGPTLRARRGETVKVNVRNSLPETSSVHWHGMHVPAAMDGGPHQSIAPTDTWSPEWTIDQPAATLWYHPHPHGATGRHVYQGLSGLFIIDDDEEEALDLPRGYGSNDIPLIVQDKKFTSDNQFDDDPGMLSQNGVLGDEILVNGTHSPYLDVHHDRVRLRILNGSGARFFNFGFSDDRPFQVIASDGGLLERPHATRRLQLSPGERAELVVELEAGRETVLRSYPPELHVDFIDARPHGGHDAFDVLQLRTASTVSSTAAVPDVLTDPIVVDTTEVAATRTFELSGFTVNGQVMDMNRIDFGVAANSVEIWEVRNVDSWVHNFHVHDVQFQVLSVGGQPPQGHMAGWKDTVQVYNGSPVRVAMRFGDLSDPNLPYMYHCHILYHEDQGLMGQFVVLGDGEEIGTVPYSDTGHDHGLAKASSTPDS